ncbi:MAG: hypothetical protein WBL65_26965 [Bryobacteraceae bacterium]
MKSKKQSRSSKAPASCSEAEELGRLKLVRRLLAGSAVEVTEAEAIRRLRVADAELKEMDLRRRSGELIELAKVEAAWADVGVTIKNALLAVPNRVLNQVRSELRAELSPILEAEVRAVLVGLSDKIRGRKRRAGRRVRRRPSKRGARKV